MLTEQLKREGRQINEKERRFKDSHIHNTLKRQNLLKSMNQKSEDIDHEIIKRIFLNQQFYQKTRLPTSNKNLVRPINNSFTESNKNITQQNSEKRIQLEPFDKENDRNRINQQKRDIIQQELGLKQFQNIMNLEQNVLKQSRIQNNDRAISVNSNKSKEQKNDEQNRPSSYKLAQKNSYVIKEIPIGLPKKPNFSIQKSNVGLGLHNVNQNQLNNKVLMKSAQSQQRINTTYETPKSIEKQVQTDSQQQKYDSNSQLQTKRNGQQQMPCLIPKNLKGRQRQSSQQSIQKQQNTSLVNKTMNQKVVEQGLISARQYVVVDRVNGKILISHNPNLQRECASLTKIMTCYLCIALCEQWKLEMNEIYVQVSKKAGRMIGTSATLQKQSWVSLWDLMYGMMLPSGNDSALCVAENLGYMATLSREELKRKMVSYQQLFGDNEQEQSKYQNVKFFQTNNQYNSMQFIQMMNEQAYFLGMNQSRFNNSHGLADRFNKSSPNDIGMLAYRAMKHPRFREIVRTINYVSQHLDGLGQTITLQWENTNKLLQINQKFNKSQSIQIFDSNPQQSSSYQSTQQSQQQQPAQQDVWDGLKTGITCTAGPCLVSSNRKHIIVLFNSKSMEARWKESQILTGIASNLQD